MLGELNWIFTAITDTIAWNVLPKTLFQRLFRQDLLVASLFRNFLLAERVMRAYDCQPVSQPALPPTFQHPMWQAWDLALDLCLAQLARVQQGAPVPALAILCPATDGISGVADLWFGAVGSTRTVAHRPTGAAQPDSQGPGTRPAGQVSRPGTLGRQSGPLCGNLSVHLEAASELRPRPSSTPRIHLGLRYWLSTSRVKWTLYETMAIATF
ncbi:hypothetical protein MRX96_000874 [Rhipicephalus microplus]